MKAVLVIDMPNDMKIQDTKALHITLFNGLFTKDISMNCSLKPLPEKDEEPEEEMKDFIYKDYDRMASYFVGLINGRNDVINEILGDYDAVD